MPKAQVSCSPQVKANSTEFCLFQCVTPKETPFLVGVKQENVTLHQRSNPILKEWHKRQVRFEDGFIFCTLGLAPAQRGPSAQLLHPPAARKGGAAPALPKAAPCTPLAGQGGWCPPHLLLPRGKQLGEYEKRSLLLALASPTVRADGLLAAEQLGGHQDGTSRGRSSSELKAAPCKTPG